MIYISSSCVKARSIKDAIEKIHSWGYTNIELSGGTQPYEGMVDDLLSLKKKYKLNLLCHNYFPPPQENFVLNLASLNKDIHHKSVEHAKSAIDLSVFLGAKKYSVHAGFLIDIPIKEIGKSIAAQSRFNSSDAKEKFIETVNVLADYAIKKDIELYIENNVISHTNFQNFNQSNPFFLCDMDAAMEFKKLLPNVKILADIAHLHVSVNTLGLDFFEQAGFFIQNADYIHVSDNNGKADTNDALQASGNVYSALKNMDIKNKIITLEVYKSENEIQRSFQLISDLQ